MTRTIPSLMLTLSLLAALAVAGPATAQDGAVTTREQVEQRLEDLKGRLDLTDYQWTQVEMILRSSIRERMAIAERYGLDGDPATFSELEGSDKRAMRRELKDCRKDTAKRMKRYLDKDQYKEFKALQESIHEELLARLDQA